MSSLYLSEVCSINLVKWIQRAKILQTDAKAEDRGPDGLADWREKYRAVGIYKEKKDRVKYLSRRVKKGG